MRLLFSIISIICTSCTLHAQLFYNNGAQITLTSGAVMIVKTNDLLNDSGVIDNAGTVVVEGSITNNDSLTGANITGGEYALDGNWINNAVFRADQCLVNLKGGNQMISGSKVSFFHDLTAGGTGIKRLDNLNAYVGNQLNLTNVEVATVTDTLFVTNTATNAIQRGTGFVSSLGNGRISRLTNSVDVYLFPVGSSLGTNRYRPVEITPTTATLQEFGVRLANVDALLEGYDRDKREDELCKINPLFFHLIDRIQGSDPVDIRMFYSYLQDGQWSRMVHWEGNPAEWTLMPGYNPGVKNGFETLETFAWDDFSSPAFALGVVPALLDAGPDEEILLGASVQLDPTYFGSDIDSVFWSPIEELSCYMCEDPVASPASTTTYTVRILSDLGCWVHDSLTVFVKAQALLLPTGFSPNKDGMNDIFRPFNDNFEQLYFAVYNRWGELMFESSDPNHGWDGTHNGKEQPIDNYVYFVEYRLEGQTGLKTERGNITLLR